MEPRSESEALTCAFRGVVYRREGSDAARLDISCRNSHIKRMMGLPPEGTLSVSLAACRICKHHKTGAGTDTGRTAEADDLSWLTMLDSDGG